MVSVIYYSTRYSRYSPRYVLSHLGAGGGYGGATPHSAVMSSMAMSPRQLVPRSPWKAMAEAWLGLGGLGQG